MKKHIKILLAVSVVSIFVGVSMMLGAYLALRENADDTIAGLKFEEKHLTVTDPISHIHISTINASIELLPSDDDICHIVLQDHEKLFHQVSVTSSASGTQLNIHQQRNWQWYEMLYGLLQREDLSLRIYLPESEYLLLHADSESGDITVAPGFRFQTVYTYTASGNTKMTTLYTENLTVSSLSGDLSLCDLEAEQDAFFESISGFKQIENLTASNVTVNASSGGAMLQNISAGTLCTTAVSGDIHILSGNFSGTTYLETGSGNIQIADSGCGEQTLQTDSGSVTLQNISGSSLNAGSSSGTILVENACYTGNLLARTTSGEILLNGADAGTLELFSSSGDISGNLLSPKIFITETSSGHVRIPPSDEGSGTCHASTVSGNISISLIP